jgi:hypothetical protein
LASDEIEFSSKLLSELGGNALGSPAFGGSGALSSIAFIFLLRGCFLKKKTLSSNYRFSRAID